MARTGRHSLPRGGEPLNSRRWGTCPCVPDGHECGVVRKPGDACVRARWYVTPPDRDGVVEGCVGTPAAMRDPAERASAATGFAKEGDGEGKSTVAEDQFVVVAERVWCIGGELHAVEQCQKIGAIGVDDPGSPAVR